MKEVSQLVFSHEVQALLIEGNLDPRVKYLLWVSYLAGSKTLIPHSDQNVSCLKSVVDYS